MIINLCQVLCSAVHMIIMGNYVHIKVRFVQQVQDVK